MQVSDDSSPSVNRLNFHPQNPPQDPHSGGRNRNVARGERAWPNSAPGGRNPFWWYQIAPAALVTCQICGARRSLCL